MVNSGKLGIKYIYLTVSGYLKDDRYATRTYYGVVLPELKLDNFQNLCPIRMLIFSIFQYFIHKKKLEAGLPFFFSF